MSSYLLKIFCCTLQIIFLQNCNKIGTKLEISLLRMRMRVLKNLNLFTADKFSNSYTFWLTISFLIPLPLNDPKVDTKLMIYGRGARACRAAENDVTRISYRYINIKTNSRQLYRFHFSFCHALGCLLIPLGTAAIRPSRR